MKAQPAVGLDPERGRDVLGAGNGAWAAIARNHIEVWLGRMWPSVLYVGTRDRHRIPLDQRRAIHVDVVAGELPTDRLVEHRLRHAPAPIPCVAFPDCTGRNGRVKINRCDPSMPAYWWWAAVRSG